jgi:hypothetical protein
MNLLVCYLSAFVLSKDERKSYFSRTAPDIIRMEIKGLQINLKHYFETLTTARKGMITSNMLSS